MTKNITSKNSTPLSHDVINRNLKNTLYYGWIVRHGEGKFGKHIPLISKELFDTCQYVLAKHRDLLIRKRKHNYQLRGFLYCYYCGQRYIAEPQSNHSVTCPGGVYYYHSQKRGRNGCPSSCIELSEIEHQVMQTLQSIQFSDVFIESVVNQTRNIIDLN